MKASKVATPKSIQDCHALLLWIIPLLDQFPKNRRFTLGERLESGLLNVLSNLISAAYQHNKRALLTQANQDLAIVRHLWRLSYELRAISLKRYEYGSRLLLELGRQIGGWMKSIK